MILSSLDWVTAGFSVWQKRQFTESVALNQVIRSNPRPVAIPEQSRVAVFSSQCCG